MNFNNWKRSSENSRDLDLLKPALLSFDVIQAVTFEIERDRILVQHNRTIPK